jgi:hypothetical protein
MHLPQHPCPQQPPWCSTLFIQLPLQRLNLFLASFSQLLPTPLLSFFHSDLARLPPPMVPHPEVELIEPASAASPHAAICISSSPVAKSGRQGGMCVATDIARHQWHTSQHIFCSANIQAGLVVGNLLLLAELKNIGSMSVWPPGRSSPAVCRK